MLEGKLIIIPALGHQNKGKSSFTGLGLFVLMSHCVNNHELALQHGGFPTMRSFVAKGLILHSINQNYIQCLALVFNTAKFYLVRCVCIQKTKLTSGAWVWGIEAKYASSVWLKAIFANCSEEIA